MKLKPVHIAKFILGPLFNLMFPVKYIGKKRTESNKQKIIICNHLSMIEPVILVARHRKMTYFMGKSDFWKEDNKFIVWALNFAQVTPIERGKPDIQALKKIMSQIKDGKNIGIFPEGTRNKDGNFLQRFESGVSMFSIKGKIKIAPLIFLKRPKFLKKNIMIAGDAIDLSEFYGERINSELLEKTDKIIFQKMLELKDMTDYYSSLDDEQKRIVRKMLNNPKIPFDEIYCRYKHLFLTHNGKLIT